MRPARGLSLIELLVALTLGAIVLGGVLRTFVASQEGYRVQEDAARVQDSLRFAAGMLARAIRQAAFLGGVGPENVQTGFPTSPTDAPCSLAWNADPAHALRAFDGTSRSPATICTVGRYVAQSDILVTTFADPDDTPTPATYRAGSPETGSGNLFLRVLAGERGFLFDGAEQRAAAEAALPGAAADGILEYRLRTLAWSLGHFDDPSDSLAPTPTLYVCDSAARCGVRTNPQPVVGGIEQFQVDFGIDENADRVAERFLPAAALTEAQWAQVLVVRLGLVARGERHEPFGAARDFVLPGGYRHRPADDARTPIDERRLTRRAFVETVQVRNRVRR